MMYSLFFFYHKFFRKIPKRKENIQFCIKIPLENLNLFSTISSFNFDQNALATVQKKASFDVLFAIPFNRYILIFDIKHDIKYSSI